MLFIVVIIVCIAILYSFSKISILDNKNVQLSPFLSKKDVENLKKSQKKMLEMMKVFHNLCVKYNIRYMLWAGSLLGATLYNGWIPWDGDFDIQVHRDDYQKLREILIKELPDTMWFQDNTTDPKYPKNFITKIRDLNSCYTSDKTSKWHSGLQIDISLFMFDANNIFRIPEDKFRTITYNDVFPLKLQKFEDTFFYVPKNAEKMVTANYGEGWKKILPINERYPHEGLMDPDNSCPQTMVDYPHLYPKTI